jgi:uncharacterized protein YceK
MRNTWACLIALLLLVTVGGCGTMTNITGHDYCLLGGPVGPPCPFGGTSMDAQMICDNTGSCTLALLDLPLSIAGDMITLPWTAFVYTREQRQPSGKFNAGPGPFANGNTEPPMQVQRGGTNALQNYPDP